MSFGGLNQLATLIIRSNEFNDRKWVNAFFHISPLISVERTTLKDRPKEFLLTWSAMTQNKCFEKPLYLELYLMYICKYCGNELLWMRQPMNHWWGFQDNLRFPHFFRISVSHNQYITFSRMQTGLLVQRQIAQAMSFSEIAVARTTTAKPYRNSTHLLIQPLSVQGNGQQGAPRRRCFPMMISQAIWCTAVESAYSDSLK